MLHILIHSFIDSIKILPFIFLVYFIIEYLEHHNNTDLSHVLMKSKRTGPIIGAFLGCIPQCGFSVIAADLFSKNTITLGTLVAIFIATSDEAIPILLSQSLYAHNIILIMGIKLVVAIISGIVIDLFFYKQTEHNCNHKGKHNHFHGNCESCDGGILKSAIVHSIKIFLFVFAVTFVFDLLIENIGEQTISKILLADSVFQPFVASLIGLIPNCGASVILTQGYIASTVTFASLVGGLSTSAGVGLLVLFKHNKNLKQNLTVVLLLYLIGVFSGVVISLF